MIDLNLILITETLANKFNLIITTVNSLGEERENSVKIKKKDFLEQIKNSSIHATVVDNHPLGDMKIGWLYIKRNGKTAWLRERENG